MLIKVSPSNNSYKVPIPPGITTKPKEYSFRYFHPNKVAYTFWNYSFNARERNFGWRIDYFLISERIMNKMKAESIHPEFYGSGHCPISLEIDL